MAIRSTMKGRVTHRSMALLAGQVHPPATYQMVLQAGGRLWQGIDRQGRPAPVLLALNPVDDEILSPSPSGAAGRVGVPTRHVSNGTAFR